MIDVIKEQLRYEDDTGIVYWNKRSRGRRKTLEAGCSSKGTGYRVVRIGTSTYSELIPVHRIAWVLKHDRFPEQIDHIDGNRMNNKFENLREVTKAENSRNRRLSSNNKSGYHGVFWYKSKNKWQVKIAQKHLGYFSDKDEAIKARKAAEVKYGYHENHGI